MVSNLETKEFFKDCVKVIRVQKFNYLDEIRGGAEYLRLSKEYDNLENLIYLAEDKVDEVREMKKILSGAKEKFKTNPDYGLIKFYLLMKYKKDTHRFLMKYGDKVLREIAGREPNE